jgi:pyruvate, water dikinase
MADAPYIAWFDATTLGDRDQVGGKGASLGELTRAGIAVPPGFVVTTAAFERALAALEREAPVRASVAALGADALDEITARASALRPRFERAALPDELTVALTAAWAQLTKAHPGAAVAVRSSATCEDAADASFAGLQDTYLWVPDLTQVLQRVRSCWGSLYSVESLSYRRTHAFAEERVAMAVVVQLMVDARSAGVMFTRSPTTGDRSVVTIEGAWGLGSAVVGGEVTPDHWVLSKITGEISVREISDKAIRHARAAGGGIEVLPVGEGERHAPCLSDAELQALGALARRIERHYKSAQDIEWAIDRASGTILLLQSRPETVWSARESEPIARGEQDPLRHLMSIFGKNPCP